MPNAYTSLKKLYRSYTFGPKYNGKIPVDSVAIETQGNCNRDCNYCPREKERSGQLKTEYVEKVINELAAVGYDGRLQFHYFNEPLLEPRLTDFIKYSDTRVPDAHIWITTNGDLLDKAKIDDLITAGVQTLKVSAHQEETEVEMKALRDRLGDQYDDFFGLRATTLTKTSQA